jgi:hypothetical protein
MITFNSQQIKQTPELNGLLQLIKRTHQLPSFVLNELEQNGAGHRAATRFYAEFGLRDGGGHPLFVHYDTFSWVQDDGTIIVQMEGLGIYESAEEYHSVRVTDIQQTLAKGNANEELVESR